MRTEIDWLSRKTGQEPDPDAVQVVLDRVRDGLSQLSWHGAGQVLTPEAASGLEAVIHSNGSRPSLLVEDDFVDTTAPLAESWVAGLTRIEAQVRQVCGAVGRIDDPSPLSAVGYLGTAWAIGEGLVATNYHVLQAIAPSGSRVNGRFQGRLRTGVAVHFGHEVKHKLPERRFPVRRVVAVGGEGAARYIHPDFPLLNFDGLDLAVLQLEAVPRRAFPRPVEVAHGDDPVTHGALASTGRGVYVVGFPGEPDDLAPDLFKSLFSNLVGYKRLAPGRITAAPGEVADDPRRWMLAHDASTLGGSSGSAVVDYLGGASVLGLHVGGGAGHENWAHATEHIGAILRPPPGGVVR